MVIHARRVRGDPCLPVVAPDSPRDTPAFCAAFGRSISSSTDAFAGGVAWNAPLGFARDRIALGYLQAQSKDSRLPADKGLNAYWKWQLTDSTDFTVDLQYYFQRSKAEPGDDDNAVLLGLRARVIF